MLEDSNNKEEEERPIQEGIEQIREMVGDMAKVIIRSTRTIGGAMQTCTWKSQKSETDRMH